MNNLSKELTIFLSDDSQAKFTDVKLAIDFCEKEFGFNKSKDWNIFKVFGTLDDLVEYLCDEYIEIDYG